MKKQNRIFAVFAILIFIQSPSLYSRIVVQSGHQDDVRALVYNEKYNYLLSTGDDGTVKIWSADKQTLLYNITLSYLPITGLVCHPGKPQFAALIKTSLTQGQIIVFDWEKDKKKYSIDIQEDPVFISYSPLGTYLFVGTTDWNSIIIRNSETGQVQPLLKEGFGIVSYIAVSKSETNLMAYLPSGKIIYKALATGKDLLKTPLKTLENLSAISVAPNSQFMAAATADKLVLINVTNGNTITSIEQKNIIQTAVKPDSSEIICITAENDVNNLYYYTLENDKLINTSEVKGRKPNAVINNAVYVKENLVIGTDTGAIYTVKNNEKILFSKNNLLEVSDVVASADQVVFSNRNDIIFLPVELLNPYSGIEISYNVFPNVFNSQAGMVFYKPNKLLIWNKLSSPAGFQIMDILSGELAEKYDGFSSPLADLEINKKGILAVMENGTTQILDKRTFDPLFEYSTKGLNRIAYASDDYLVASLTKLNQLGSALMLINTSTGETAPVPIENILCYDVLYDPAADSIYSLGVVNAKDNKTNTVLKINKGKGYEQELEVYRFASEDMSASIALDEENKNVYTTLGYDAVRVYTNSRLSLFAESKDMPRKLYVVKRFLIAINKNGFLTVWDRTNKKKMMDLYLIDTPDHDWIVLLPDNTIAASIKGMSYLKEY